MNTRSMNKRNMATIMKEFVESQEQKDPNFSDDKSFPESPMIDFDEASRAWRQNKRPLSNGCFEYICKEQKKLSIPTPTPTPPRRNPPRNRRNLNNGA